MRALSGRHDVIVLHLVGAVANQGPLWRVEETLDSGVPVIRVTYRLASRPWRWIVETVAVTSALATLRRRQFHPDVVHAHVYLAGVHARFISWILRRPLVVTEHYTKILGAARRLKGLDRQRARFVYRTADIVLPVGGALERAVLDLVPSARTVVVPNVVDVAGWRPSRAPAPGPPRFVTVAGMRPEKGVDIVLCALSELRRHGVAAKLDIVGDGPAREELAQFAQDLGIAQAATFHGFLPKHAIGTLLDGATALVAASRVETFGVAIAEALAVGLPVVVTASGGPEEFVDDRDGIVVPVEDVRALADAMLQTVLHAAEYDRDAIADRARRRFRPDAIAGRLSEIYSGLLRS